MKFLFLDLEYNQSIRCKNDIAKGQHIIQCAYIITDYNFKPIITRNIYIKYNLDEIRNVVTDITGITKNLLNKKGIKFKNFIYNFINDCKAVGCKDLNIITWGDNDIDVLKSNCLLFKMEYKFLFAFKVFNLQYFFTFMKMPNIAPLSLKKAHDMIANNFEQSVFSENRHNAYNDVEATISIAKSLDLSVMLNNPDKFKISNDKFGNAKDVSVKINYKLNVKNVYKCHKCSKFTKVLYKDPAYYNKLIHSDKFCDLRYCSHCGKAFIRVNLSVPKSQIIHKTNQIFISSVDFDKQLKKHFYTYKCLKKLVNRGMFDNYIQQQSKTAKN